MPSILSSLHNHKIRQAAVYFLIIASVLFLGLELLSSTPQNEPDLNVKVDDFSPEGSTNQATNITVKFTRDMIEKDSLDKVVTDPPLEFEPEIKGIARWIDQDVLRFYPDQKLLPATGYIARVKSDKTYLHGNKINEQRKFNFYTDPLMIRNVYWTETSPADRPNMRNYSLEIYFNYAVDPVVVSDYISITGDENAAQENIDFEITYSYNRETNTSSRGDNLGPGDVLTFKAGPVKITDQDQTYKLIIEKDLKCPDCGEGLVSEFVKNLKVAARERLTVNRVEPRYSGQMGIIDVNFSADVASSEAEDFVSIDPETDFRIRDSYRGFMLEGDFKPDVTYTVDIAKGLKATNGSVLEREYSSKFTMPDYPATIAFLNDAIYMPREGNKLLEIETMNIDQIVVEVERFFANNLIYLMAQRNQMGRYYGNDVSRILGQTFFETERFLGGTKNQPLTTTIDIGSIIGDSTRGVFKISARKKDRRWDQQSRYVMITDLGIMARKSGDYLMVWVNSLSEVKPVKNAMVQLWSRNNQMLLEDKTDSRGIVVFDDFAERIGDFEPYLITVSHDEDLAYLEFNQARLPVTDFEIKGRPYIDEGFDAFVYSDRGIYRPGDTAHIGIIIREADGKLPDKFPYFLTINDPSGREFKSFRLNSGASSFDIIDVSIPEFAQTGRYSIIAHIGQDLEIGRSEFQVEEFMPDRIKVEIDTRMDEYSPGEVIRAEVESRFLFGPPVGRFRVSGSMSIEKRDFGPTEYSSYTFENREREFSQVRERFPDATLSDSGTYTYNYTIPAGLRPPSALRGILSASVTESGGRTVTNYKILTIHPYERYLGLRLEFEGYADPGKPAEASLVAVNADGKSIKADSIYLKFERLVYQSILKRDEREQYRYVSEVMPELIDSMYISTTGGNAQFSFTAPNYGSYRITAIDPNGGHSSSVQFYASGWGYAPWSMANPDRIEIDLDKDHYTEKDKARVQIKAPFSGKLLVTVEQDQVLEFITYKMEDNTAEISIPVKKDYFPNAYITATVIKRADQIEKRDPARAFGVAPLMIDTDNRKLEIEINAPEVISPKTTLELGVRISQPGTSDLTVAAVDEGILQLIDYSTPDLLEHFYGKRMLGLTPYDIYSFIYPEVERAESHLSPAGDRALMEARARHISPISAMRIKPVALWSGKVSTNDTGYAEVLLDVPQFNGQLRVMVVAAQRELFGSADADVIVRDDIVIQESFPRFVAPNDIFDGRVMVYNNTGENRDITVGLDCDGPVSILSADRITVPVADGEGEQVKFELQAQAGVAKIECEISAQSEGDSSQISFEMANRPATPPQTEYGAGSVTQDQPAEFTFEGNWLDNTQRYIVQTSSLAAAQFTGNINYLVSYPYGCLEQTVSRAFPLLYFDNLAKFVSPELVGSGGPDYFIQETILKLKGMIRSDGWFSFWPNGDYVSNWGSVYAADFLLEAKRSGFPVSADISESQKNLLTAIVLERTTKTTDLATRMYAAYVLAKNDLLNSKTANTIRAVSTKDLPLYSRFHKAGALALAGDMEYARGILPQDIQPQIFDPETGGNFSSGTRSNAIMLEVLTIFDEDDPDAAVLADRLIESARTGRWYTTQETSFALIALGKYLATQENPDFEGTLTIDGKDYSIGTDEFRRVFNQLESKTATLEINGQGRCFYYWQSGGVPLDDVAEEYTRGIEISREYMDLNGDAVDLNSIELGQQVICKIEAIAENDQLEHVVINDMLPAGFEIENPRLKNSASLRWLPESDPEIRYQDIRDDRLLLFTDLNTDKPVTYYYSLRAIASGNFIVPPIMAECMYNPLIAGASSSARVVVSE